MAEKVRAVAYLVKQKMNSVLSVKDFIRRTLGNLNYKQPSVQHVVYWDLKYTYTTSCKVRFPTL